MIDDLIRLKKITRREANIYELFIVNESGRKWFKDTWHETFMDCAPPNMMNGEVLAYADGRRSILRDIVLVREKIDQLLAEQNLKPQTGYINE